MSVNEMSFKVGDEVEIIGRPYGDCPELDYRIANNPPAGTRLTVRKVYEEPDAAELSDGFYYPASAFRSLAH